MNEREIAAGLATTPSYRYADVVGRQLFVAGQVPRNSSNELVGIGQPDVQTRACLENLFAVVLVNGFERSDIRQLVIHVVGEQENLSVAWDEVVAAFDGDVPPATLLGAARLGYVDQLVEIDATVVRDA
jgi:enamine deaminase RidA (YjgF/YER057c/UK114 family)